MSSPVSAARRPGKFRTTLLALRRPAGLADVGNHESIGDDAFRMALKSIAVRQVFHEVVANSQRGLFKFDVWCTLHQRSFELVAADHLVQHQQMPRIYDVLVVLQPIAIFDEADGEGPPQARATTHE